LFALFTTADLRTVCPDYISCRNFERHQTLQQQYYSFPQVY